MNSFKRRRGRVPAPMFTGKNELPDRSCRLRLAATAVSIFAAGHWGDRVEVSDAVTTELAGGARARQRNGRPTDRRPRGRDRNARGARYGEPDLEAAAKLAKRSPPIPPKDLTQTPNATCRAPGARRRSRLRHWCAETEHRRLEMERSAATRTASSKGRSSCVTAKGDRGAGSTLISEPLVATVQL